MIEMTPVPIMEVQDKDGVKKFLHRQDNVDQILLHPEIKDRKVVVMSIIGEYRKGKSFFLGYCLRYLYANYSPVSSMSNLSSQVDWLGNCDEPLIGFKGKHGRHADTKGILFWPDVFLYDKSDDEKIAIILMDTQGLFETGSTEDENAKIFGLSTLISSIQIINVKGEIQENQIEYLEMATNLSKFISDIKKSPWKPFQKLLFLIRDWTHEDIEGSFGYGGGRTYLNEFLEETNRSNTKAQSVRKNIHDSFDSIECFLLNHPGKFVGKADFSGEWSKLEDDFVQNLKVVIESLLSAEKLNTKSIFGKEVTAAEFRDYINAYFEAFRNSKLPETENIFVTMVNNQMKVIIEELIKNYKTSINNEIDFGREDFENYINEKHQTAKDEAILEFNEIEKVQDAEKILKFQSVLLEEIEKFFSTWRESTMREHKMHLQYKKQLGDVESEMEKYQEKISKLHEEMQQEIEKNARIQKEMEEQNKKQEEDLQKLISDFSLLTLKSQEKEEEMQKLKADLEKKDEENNQKLNELEEANKVKIKILESKMQEDAKKAQDEHQKVLERHQRELEKFQKANDRNFDAMNRKLKIQQENEKRKNDEQRQEREKLSGDVNDLRKNFNEMGEIIEDENETVGVDILKSIANIVKVISKRKLVN